jgi:hypothetical protein
MSRKIIACEVFRPYLEQLFQKLPREEIDYLEVKQHDHPERLAELLQAKIDAIEDASEILLLYGLCGNAILPLKARSIPLRVIRVHDCGAVLLGSNLKYRQRFENKPNKRYHCLSYGDREEEYFARTSPEYHKIAQEYGEDNADYVFDLLYIKNTKPVTYIKFGLEGEDEMIAKRESGYYVEVEGDLGMLERVLCDPNGSESLTLLPNRHFEGIYDYEEILKTVLDEETK